MTFALVGIVLISIAGCDTGETSSPSQSTTNERVAELLPSNALGQFASVEIGLPEKPRPWDGSAAGLQEAIKQVDGRVVIGIKHSQDPRTEVTGRVPAVSRDSFEVAIGRLRKMGVSIRRPFRTMPIIAASIAPRLISQLLESPWVNYVEPSVNVRAAVSRSHTAHILQSSQDTSWGVKAIGAPHAWAVGYNGNGANIWILDSGADSTHVHSLDGDWNLSNAVCGWAVVLNFEDCYEDLGGIGHGSLVHTVAVGRDNGVGYIGVAHGVSANTMIRICTGAPFCVLEAAANALDSAIAEDEPRTIVNMSFGGDQDLQFLREAITRASNAGIFLVAAAGNNDNPDSGILYPARYGAVVAVTGTTPSNSFAGPGALPCGFSNSGDEAEISAPFEQSGADLEGEYQTSCGTSFAAPAVAGVAALIWDKNPTWSAAQVRTHLQITALDLGPAGRDPQFGYGRLDACAAVKCAVSFTLSGPGTVQEGQDATWSVANLTGGLAPYSYKWRKDGVLQSGETGSTYETSFSSTGTHEIKATVTPAEGLSWTEPRSVLVTGSGCGHRNC